MSPPYLGDVVEIDSTLLDSNVIGLIGPAGSGKSWLAQEIVIALQRRRPHEKTDVCHYKAASCGSREAVFMSRSIEDIFLDHDYSDEREDTEDMTHTVLVIDDCHLIDRMISLPLTDWLPNKLVHVILMSQINNGFMSQLAHQSGYTSYFMNAPVSPDPYWYVTLDGKTEAFESQREQGGDDSEEDDTTATTVSEDETPTDEDVDLVVKATYVSWTTAYDFLARNCNDIEFAIKILGRGKSRHVLMSTPEPEVSHNQLSPTTTTRKVLLKTPQELSHADRKRIRSQNERRMPSLIGGGQFKPMKEKKICDGGPLPADFEWHSAPRFSTVFSSSTDDLYQWMQVVKLDDTSHNSKLESAACAADISAAWWV